MSGTPRPGSKERRDPALQAAGLGKGPHGDWLCATCEYQNSQRDERCSNKQCPTRCKDFSRSDLPQDLAGLFEPKCEGWLSCKSCDSPFRANDLWRMRSHWYFSQARNRFYCRTSGEMLVKSTKNYVNLARRSTMGQRSHSMPNIVAGRSGSIPSPSPRHARTERKGTGSLRDGKPGSRGGSSTQQAIADAMARAGEHDDDSSDGGSMMAGGPREDVMAGAFGDRAQLSRPSRWQLGPPATPDSGLSVMFARAVTSPDSPLRGARRPSVKDPRRRRSVAHVVSLKASDAKQDGIAPFHRQRTRQSGETNKPDGATTARGSPTSAARAAGLMLTTA